MNSTLTKERAVRLRQNGLSYSEIGDYLSVPESTLSYWLSKVVLQPEHVKRLAKRKLNGEKRGARSRNIERLNMTGKIRDEAISEIGLLSQRDLLLIGTSLYWAEGSKESPDSPGSGIIFTNQDYRMVCVFLKFLEEVCEVKTADIRPELYIHLIRKSRTNDAVKFWSLKTGIPADRFKVYYKNSTRSANRQIVKKIYHGLIRVRVSKSSVLIRRLAGWSEGISKNCGVV